MFKLLRRWRSAVWVLRALDRSTAIVHLGLDGKVIKANPLFGDIFGLRPQELEGQPHAMLCVPDYAASAQYQDFWRRLRAGETFGGLFQRRHKDGHLVWLRATYNPVFDAAGRLYKVVKFASDISEQVQQQQAESEAAQLAYQVSRNTDGLRPARRLRWYHRLPIE